MSFGAPSNLPPGTTDADIERQANGDCSICAKCPHDEVELDIVNGWDEGVASCGGTCTGCNARMQGKGRRRDPEGGVEDIEWQVDDNGCEHDDGPEPDSED